MVPSPRISDIARRDVILRCLLPVGEYKRGHGTGRGRQCAVRCHERPSCATITIIRWRYATPSTARAPTRVGAGRCRRAVRIRPVPAGVLVASGVNKTVIPTMKMFAAVALACAAFVRVLRKTLVAAVLCVQSQEKISGGDDGMARGEMS